jgi:hypothetical protein
MGGRVDSPNRNNVPGPGQYDPNESITKHKAASFKIDEKTQRTKFVSKDQMSLPGPGNYSDSK